MQSCAIEGGALAAPTIFADGLPEPVGVDLPLPRGEREAEGEAGELAGPPRSGPLRTAAISAALVFAMLAYLGMWAAVIAALLAGVRSLMQVLHAG
jgi:hypothetical protein